MSANDAIASPLARTHAASRLGWATQGVALGLILVVLAVRIVYLVWLSRYELVGDEAYYWEWSRHLELCYYEKGPGLALLIAGSVRLFGDSEWAVRLPVAVSSAVAAWLTGKLAVSASGDRRAGFFAVVLFLVCPAFAADAQICTQDGPLIALWALIAWIGLRLIRQWTDDGRFRHFDWLMFCTVLGVGFLFKQSFLLVALGLPAYLLLRRPRVKPRPAMFLQLAAGAALFVLVISPMLIWNYRHGWPTLMHTEGHLGTGGDQKGESHHLNPLWALSLLGAQLGSFGPPAILIMAGACLWAWRSRRTEPAFGPARLWLICCALPSLLFFLLLSLWKPVIGSWPFPSFVTLVALAGAAAAAHVPPRTEENVGAPDGAAPARGLRIAWDAALVYGIVGWVILSVPTLLLPIPGAGGVIRKSVLPRISGHRVRAYELHSLLQGLATPDGAPPVLAASYYMNAALDAFYLPGHPIIYCADAPLGKRATAYDYWDRTDLYDPRLRGRSFLLIGSERNHWARALQFDRVEPLADEGYFLGVNYQGVRPRVSRHPK